MSIEGASPEEWSRAMAVLAAMSELPLAPERIALFDQAQEAIHAEQARVRVDAAGAEPHMVFDPRWD